MDERATFELLVLVPILLLIAVHTVFYAYENRRESSVVEAAAVAAEVN